MITDKYQIFIQKITEISLRQRIIDSAFKRELEALNEYHLKKDISDVIRRDVFNSYNIFTGESELYGHREITVSALTKMTISHKNFQYCWLLANAFEQFENFITDVYLEVNSPDAKSKRDVNKFLSFFTEKYDYLKQHEKNNASKMHLRVIVLFIEQLRHLIVHKECKLPVELEAFIDKVIKKSGINNNRSEHEAFAKQYFNNGYVYIIEVPLDEDSLLPLYHDTYTHLISYLIGYARLLTESVSCEKIV